MIGDKTTMFGKTYNTVGSSDSNFLIKTKGDLKIQWGNKFIDLIKGGKIVEQSVFKTVASENDIVTDGIYLINDTIWIKINGTKVPIPKSSTTYLSFSEKQNLTPEQKTTALTNVGLLYNSLNDIDLTNISDGIIYILETKKLYTVTDGYITEYQNVVSSQQLSDIIKGDRSLSFFVGDFVYAIMSDLRIQFFKDLVMEDNKFIMSENATSENGFRLYQEADQSTLEVDDIVWRNRIEPTFFGGEYLPLEVIHTGWHNIVESIQDIEYKGNPYNENEANTYYTTIKLKYPKSDEDRAKDAEVLKKFGETAVLERNIHRGDYVSIICNIDRVQYICVVEGSINNGKFDVTCKWVEPKEFIQFYQNKGNSNLEYPTGEPFKIQNMFQKNPEDAFYFSISDGGNTITIDLNKESYSQTISNNFSLDNATYIVSSGDYNVRVIFNKKSYYNLKFKPIHKITMFVNDVYDDSIVLKYDPFDENMENGIFCFPQNKPTAIQLSRHLTNSYIYKINCKLLKNEDQGLVLRDQSVKIIPDNISEQEKIDNTIHTVIGRVVEPELKESVLQPRKIKEGQTEDPEKTQVGIYSDNFVGLDSVLYDVTFKALNKDLKTKELKYPKYDKEIKLPSNEGYPNLVLDKKFNNIVPNFEWIKTLLDKFIPIGTIIMFDGSSKVPPGWAVCDGNNGTPNLIGRFIKAADAPKEGGASTVKTNNPEGVSFEDGVSKFTLKEKHLPAHSHPHSSHSHTIDGDSVSADIAFKSTDYFITSTKSIKVASGNGVSVPTNSQQVEGKASNVKFVGSTSSEESKESDKEWTNTSFIIEPYSYSLIFIMKIKSFVDYTEET